MRSRRDEIDLTAELRALRPVPSREFTEALDSRIEAGFPRSGRESSSARALGPLRVLDRIRGAVRAAPRRRLIVTAGAAATAAVVVATALVVTSEGGPGSTRTALDTSSRYGSRGDERQTQFSAPASAGRASAGNAKSAGNAELAPTATTAPEGPYASHAAHRNVERSAAMVLAASPSDVRGDAAKVFESVHAYHGIVLRSSIRDGRAGQAGASFDLLIPSARLGDAMTAFSDIAEVRSRHESTLDITAQTIGVGERLQDARARVESLLSEVATAESEAEREAAEAKLRLARRRVAALRAHLANLRRHTHLSSVSLRIETGSHLSSGSGWGLGDALRDAVHILTVVAGVTLIGLAILLPPILIALLAWFAYRGWVRSRRERALD